MYHISNPANVIAPNSWYLMKVQLMAQPRCICSEHILPFDSWNSQWQPGMSLITVVWATRVRLHHASQLTKVDSWQILQWSCCWSVVSGKWGLTKLQLCPSSSVGCLQTVHDWSTVGPLAHSLLQIKIIAGTCCSLFSSIQAAILPVVGDAAAPPCAGEHSSPADSVPPWPSLWQMSPDKGFSPWHRSAWLTIPPNAYKGENARLQQHTLFCVQHFPDHSWNKKVQNKTCFLLEGREVEKGGYVMHQLGHHYKMNIL